MTTQTKLPSDQLRIMQALVDTSRSWNELALATLLPRKRLKNSLHHLTRELEPPLVNCVPGEINHYQLSPDGRKVMNINDAPPLPTTKPEKAVPAFDIKVFRGERRRMIEMIASGPCSSEDIMRALGIGKCYVYTQLSSWNKEKLIKRTKKTKGKGYLYSINEKSLEEKINEALESKKSKPLFTEDQVQYLEAMINRIIDERLKAATTTVLPEKINVDELKEPPKPKPEHMRLPRVLVAGPIGDQVRELEKEFDGLLDLRFIRDENDARSRIGSCDYAVAWTRFMNHSTDGILKSSNAKYVPVSGGMSSVKSALADIYFSAAH